LYFKGNAAFVLGRKNSEKIILLPLYFEGKTIVLGGKHVYFEGMKIVLQRKDHCTGREETLYLKGKERGATPV